MTLRLLGGFSDAELVVGDDESRRRAREAQRRQDRLAMAQRSSWTELNREDLAFGHLIEHTPTGALYSVMRGEIYGDLDPVAAYFVDSDEDVIFLQRPASGPQTRAELEEYRSRPKPAPRRMRVRA